MGSLATRAHRIRGGVVAAAGFTEGAVLSKDLSPIVYWIGLDKWRADYLAEGKEGSRVVPARVNGRKGWALVRGSKGSSLSWDNARQPARRLEVYE